MRKKHYLILIGYSLFIFLFPVNNFAQSWLTSHDSLQFASKPNATSFVDLIGANAGKEIGQNKASFKSVGKIKNVRSFHIMGSDYGNGFFPNEQTILPYPCDCGDEFYQCAPQVCRDDEIGRVKKFGFRNWKAHYCDWKKGYEMKTIQASLEAIFPKLGSVCEYDSNFNCIWVPHPCTDYGFGRNYPNKWYTKEEWGGSFQNIRSIAATYAENFAITFCPSDTAKQCLVDILEVGNEPWGKGEDKENGTADDTPGVEGYHAICWGIIDGLTKYYESNDPKNWRMKLSTAAFEAYTTTPGCGDDPNQYIEVMVPNQVENEKSLRSYFDYVSIHNYPFPKANLCSDNNLKRMPESRDGLFLTLKNMKKWMELNMPHARLSITEFGWNSAAKKGCYSVGQANQAAYLIRAFLLAARYDVYKAYTYAFYDHPEEPLFCSVGLQDKGTHNEKKALKAITKLNELIGGKHFIKAINEGNDGDNFAYLIGDFNKDHVFGKPTHLVAWKATDLMDKDTFDTYPSLESDFTNIDLGTLSVNETSGYVYLAWDNTKDGSIGDNIVRTNGNSLQVKLSGLPILIPLNPTNCTYDKKGSLIGCEESTIPENTSQTELACGDITITYGNGQIKLVGDKEIDYHTFEIINITDNKYEQIVLCPFDCDNIQIANNLPEGDYLIKVFDASWRWACKLDYETAIHLGPASEENACEDKDNDGICADEDCNDTDANLPKAVGSPCNDGNIATENDRIREDGCTCVGEEIEQENSEETMTNSLICEGVQIDYGNGQIKITGTSGTNYPMKIQEKQGDYKLFLNCHNCGSSKTVDKLESGQYEVLINYKSCGIIELKTTQSPLPDNCLNQGGDEDNDGVCNSEDCAPNDPNFPKPAGTPCNDDNDQTENDVIGENGCTCQGEMIVDSNDNNSSLTTFSCGEIKILYGDGQIEVVGVANNSYNFVIQNKGTWEFVTNCWYQCGSSQKFTQLPSGKYQVKVYLDGEICNTEITLKDNFNGQVLSRNVLELATIVQQQSIQLEWVAGGTNETESFIVEKSMDGSQFKSIDIINQPNDYHFIITDKQPDYGTNYYRIKQLFTSGNFRYSTISSEKYYLDETSITLFPNPANHEMHLRIGHFANLKGEVHIFNRLGNEIAFEKLDNFHQQLTFNTSEYENGLYFLVIEAENKRTFSRKFMVEHGN